MAMLESSSVTEVPDATDSASSIIVETPVVPHAVAQAVRNEINDRQLCAAIVRSLSVPRHYRCVVLCSNR